MICIFIRGKIASGKTQVANILKLIDSQMNIIDPDLIDVKSAEFEKFKTVSYRTPNLKTKKYCFLFQRARTLLNQGNKVVWAQPWSRTSELFLTIRNFGFYFTDIKDKAWKEDINKIINQLPFRLALIEVNIPDHIVVERCRRREAMNEEHIRKINLHSKMYQHIELPVPTLKISGEQTPSYIERALRKFTRYENVF